MYYCLGFYPRLSAEAAQAIASIRRDYDPTSDLIPPHITLIFPTHDSIGEQALIGHIEQVLSGWNPFEIRLGGFCRARDYWLFLTLQEGEDKVKRLYRELHTGILADGRDLSRYVPHIGLGFFLKKGCLYDWRHPQDSYFDRERYEEARRRAEALPLSERTLLDKLQLTAIADEVIAWTTGKRMSFPADAEEVTVREFKMGK